MQPKQVDDVSVDLMHIISVDLMHIISSSHLRAGLVFPQIILALYVYMQSSSHLRAGLVFPQIILALYVYMQSSSHLRAGLVFPQIILALYVYMQSSRQHEGFSLLWHYLCMCTQMHIIASLAESRFLWKSTHQTINPPPPPFQNNNNNTALDSCDHTLR